MYSRGPRRAFGPGTVPTLQLYEAMTALYLKLASFERPDEGDYRDLAVAIGASILMKLRKL